MFSNIINSKLLPLGVTKLGVKKFQVKIGLDNQVSIAMFKKLHFQEVMRSCTVMSLCEMRDRPQNMKELVNLIVVVSVPGVGVSGVQRGDPRDDGGRVGSDEAAG